EQCRTLLPKTGWEATAPLIKRLQSGPVSERAWLRRLLARIVRPDVDRGGEARTLLFERLATPVFPEIRRQLAWAAATGGIFCEGEMNRLLEDDDPEVQLAGCCACFIWTGRSWNSPRSEVRERIRTIAAREVPRWFGPSPPGTLDADLRTLLAACLGGFELEDDTLAAALRATLSDPAASAGALAGVVEFGVSPEVAGPFLEAALATDRCVAAAALAAADLGPAVVATRAKMVQLLERADLPDGSELLRALKLPLRTRLNGGFDDFGTRWAAWAGGTRGALGAAVAAMDPAQPVPAGLLRGLDSESVWERLEVAGAVTHLASGPDERRRAIAQIQQVIEQERDDEPLLLRALQFAGDLGAEALPLLPAIEQLEAWARFKKRDRLGREAGVAVDRHHLAIARPKLASEDTAVAIEAAWQVWELEAMSDNRKGKELIAIMLRALQYPGRPPAKRALLLAEDMGPRAKALLPLMEKMAGDDRLSGSVRRMARRAAEEMR
ncbi:MAG: hypothetical protein ACYTGX_18225, partial [Planctomycetota bacterium]